MDVIISPLSVKNIPTRFQKPFTRASKRPPLRKPPYASRYFPVSPMENGGRFRLRRGKESAAAFPVDTSPPCGDTGSKIGIHAERDQWGSSARRPTAPIQRIRWCLWRVWRRGRDSNPRGTLWAPIRFPVVLLRPLGHLSAGWAVSQDHKPAMRGFVYHGLSRAVSPPSPPRLDISQHFPDDTVTSERR